MQFGGNTPEVQHHRVDSSCQRRGCKDCKSEKPDDVAPLRKAGKLGRATPKQQCGSAYFDDVEQVKQQ
jgi:hypothetical protein